jgi:hypothetical protein
VIPNDRVEFKWRADVSWKAFVEVFNNPDATGTPVAKVESLDAGGGPVIGPDHLVKLSVSLLQPDTGFFFRITMTDPTGTSPLPLVTQTPLPPFFTGAQTIGNVFVDAGVDRARILWDANVIGIGRVDYGIASPDELSVTDQQNVTSHSIELTSLAPGTTYQYRVCNRHAIDGDCLAAKTGSFTTLPTPPQVIQAIDDLRERVASYGLQRGIGRSLDAKLEAALNAWQAGDSAGACSSLAAFLNDVRAQTGNKLSDAQAQQLSAAANDIRTQIGC